MNKEICLLLGSTLIFFLLIPGQSLAHRVNVFAWVEGDTIFTESYFSGGHKPSGSRIEVFDPQGNRLLTGRTNERGMFSFKIPKKTDLKIVLHASMGHKAEYVLPQKELSASASPPSIDRQHQGQADTQKESRTISVDKQELEAVVGKILDEKLRPIKRKLAARESSGPTWRDIVGGIGYIVGLMGIALYFANRRKWVRKRQTNF